MFEGDRRLGLWEAVFVSVGEDGPQELDEAERGALDGLVAPDGAALSRG